MKVVLTSFRDAENWDGPKWSAARWQPKAAKYPELRFLGAWDPDTGRKLVNLPPDAFREKYERWLEKRRFAIWEFFRDREEEQIVLLCWCTPERQKKHEKLYCHLILLGFYLEKHFPDMEVIYADGRENPIWERSVQENDF